MKTATMHPPITQKTITTRTLNVDPDPRARTAPDFWEYIEALKPEEWDRHIVYIYRTDPRASNYGDGQSNIDKCPGYIEMRDGSQVPFNDREEVERAIQEKHGGKAFRLIIKRGHERVTEGKSSNDAPPKYPHQTNYSGNGSGVSVNPVSDASATADVAKAAMSAVAGQERASMSIAVDAVRSAADMVTRLAQAPNGTGQPQDDVMKQAMALLLQRALNPPDPMEQLTRFLALMNQIRPQQGVDPNLPAGSPLNRVVDMAIERLLNPVSTVAPVNASAELVRSLPNVASHVVEAIREWRVGSEAQRDTATIMAQQGAQPGVAPATAGKALPAVNATQARPMPASTAIQQPPSPTTPEGTTVAGPQLEFIETKIIEIFQENISAEDAADDCFAFLDRMDQRLIAQLAAAGEGGLMTLFNSRPILRQATSNPARLAEFIRAFLKFANESMMDPASNGVAPTMPPGNA